jgi:hypothetical protein
LIRIKNIEKEMRYKNLVLKLAKLFSAKNKLNRGFEPTLATQLNSKLNPRLEDLNISLINYCVKRINKYYKNQKPYNSNLLFVDPLFPPNANSVIL